MEVEEEKEDPRALQRPNDSLISQSEAKMVRQNHVKEEMEDEEKKKHEPIASQRPIEMHAHTHTHTHTHIHELTRRHRSTNKHTHTH